jgi:hypothetical protein
LNGEVQPATRSRHTTARIRIRAEGRRVMKSTVFFRWIRNVGGGLVNML